jgi:heterodisulfide reductase subunit C
MMSVLLSKTQLTLARDLQALTGENALLCYQCKKCTLGCPSADSMRMKPHELMRAIQLGLTKEIYWSGMIWICLSCETCNTRCPQDIDILRLIDGLREMAKRFEYYNPDPDIPGMYQIFMGLVNCFGRVHELSLAFLTQLRMLVPFKDIDLMTSMLMKKKLRLLPPRSKGTEELRKVLRNIEETERSKSVGGPGTSVP